MKRGLPGFPLSHWVYFKQNLDQTFQGDRMTGSKLRAAPVWLTSSSLFLRAGREGSNGERAVHPRERGETELPKWDTGIWLHQYCLIFIWKLQNACRPEGDPLSQEPFVSCLFHLPPDTWSGPGSWPSGCECPGHRNQLCVFGCTFLLLISNSVRGCFYLVLNHPTRDAPGDQRIWELSCWREVRKKT